MRHPAAAERSPQCPAIGTCFAEHADPSRKIATAHLCVGEQLHPRGRCARAFCGAAFRSKAGAFLLLVASREMVVLRPREPQAPSEVVWLRPNANRFKAIHVDLAFPRPILLGRTNVLVLLHFYVPLPLSLSCPGNSPHSPRSLTRALSLPLPLSLFPPPSVPQNQSGPATRPLSSSGARATSSGWRL